MVDQLFLDTEIFPKLDRAEVFKDLDPKDKGKYYLCICPGCKNRSAYIYKDKYKLHCNKENNCNYAITIMDYLNGGEKPTGQAFWQVIEKLGKMTNTKIPKPEYSQKQAEAYAQEKERLNTIEQALQSAKLSMTSQAAEYLFSRGIHPDSLPHLDIGMIKDQQSVKDLCIVTPEDPDSPTRQEIALMNAWIGRVILGIRDYQGRLRGFVGRDLTDTQEHKYLNSQGLDVRSLGAVGLDAALKSKERALFLVEGIIDVYILRSIGIENVAAIAGSGSAMDSERLAFLHKIGFKRLILLLDNDKAGRRGISYIVRNSTGNNHPSIYALDPMQYGEMAGTAIIVKDPGDAVRIGCNKERFLEFVRKNVHSGYKLFARNISAKYGYCETEANTDDFIRDCIQFDSTIIDREKTLQLERHFWPEVCKIAGVDLGFVLDVRDDMRRELLAEERKKHATVALRSSMEALQSGDLKTALHSLQEAYQATSPNIEEKQPVLRVSDRLPQHTERLSQMSGKEWIGLQQKTIKSLDEATRGLRQMITICAEPGIGKTILMTQLFEDILLANEDTCGVFVSWELSGDEILDRIKSRDTVTKWETLRLKSDALLRSKADKLLERIASRMVILEHQNCSERDLTADRIIQEVEQLKRETGCNRCVVCIDYLQIFPVPESVKAGTDLARDDYIVKEIKKIRYHLGDDPVFCISETNKNDGTMGGRNLGKAKGSGRTVYASDAVMFINRITDAELVKHLIMHNGKAVNRTKYGQSAEPIPTSKKEIEEEATAIRDSLLEDGKDFIELSISKIRDGGKRKRILLTNYYEYSSIVEGIH